MTRDELRTCMRQEDTLRSRSETQLSEVTRSNEEAASIATENATLIRASVNGFKDKATRDAHAAKVQALNQRVAAYNAQMKRLQLSVADAHTLQAEYLRLCGGRRFLQEDRNAIVAEREAGKQGGQLPEPAASAPVAR